MIAYPNVEMYFLRSLNALLDDKKIMIIAQFVGHNNKQNWLLKSMIVTMLLKIGHLKTYMGLLSFFINK